MVDWAGLISTLVFGFAAGMVTAWRKASLEATMIWVDDLRHRVEIMKGDREKRQQLRHVKMDEDRAVELRGAEEERKRIKRAHLELAKALPIANEVVKTWAVEPDRHRELVAELRTSLERLSSHGVKIEHDIDNWRNPFSHELKRIAKNLDTEMHKYAALRGR
ncbi:hypothetical protein [Streptomyces viridochromogenes]|uniref:hypothetical protein n=1 Tax=Streptomyces viridochromogenes TaxID=1938 RepID=UPI0001B4BCF3|nr:hypothetical protein [Streptomyces viridochromogenes]